jgi:hypothetical protein
MTDRPFILPRVARFAAGEALGLAWLVLGLVVAVNDDGLFGRGNGASSGLVIFAALAALASMAAGYIELAGAASSRSRWLLLLSAIALPCWVVAVYLVGQT